jgi:hypothetical protein
MDAVTAAVVAVTVGVTLGASLASVVITVASSASCRCAPCRFLQREFRLMTFRRSILLPAALTLPLQAFGQSPGAAAGTMITGGAVTPRVLAEKLGDVVTPADFIPAAGPGSGTPAQLLSGAIDAVPSISAALAAHGSVTLRCGTYLLASNPLVVNANGQHIHGESPRCVVLQATTTTGDVVQIGTAAAGSPNGPPLAHNLGIDNVTIYASAARISGYAIDVLPSWNVQASNVTISGPHWGGVQVHGGLGVAPGAGKQFMAQFDHMEIQGSTAAACFDVTDFAQDVWLTNSVLGTVPGTPCYSGVNLHDAGGVHLAHVDVIAAQTSALIIDPVAASLQSVFAVWADDFQADTSAGDNISFSGDGPISEIHFDGVWGSSSAAGHGFSNTNANLDGFMTVNFNLLGNWQDGFASTGGRNFNLALRAVQNNANPSGSFNGLSITGGDQITIRGSKLGGGGVFGTAIRAHAAAPPIANHQAYGAVIGNAVTNLIFEGNQVGGNVTAGCSLPKASPTIIRVNNIGAGC